MVEMEAFTPWKSNIDGENKPSPKRQVISQRIIFMGLCKALGVMKKHQHRGFVHIFWGFGRLSLWPLSGCNLACVLKKRLIFFSYYISHFSITCHLHPSLMSACAIGSQVSLSLYIYIFSGMFRKQELPISSNKNKVRTCHILVLLMVQKSCTTCKWKPNETWNILDVN